MKLTVKIIFKLSLNDFFSCSFGKFSRAITKARKDKRFSEHVLSAMIQNFPLPVIQFFCSQVSMKLSFRARALPICFYFLCFCLIPFFKKFLTHCFCLNSNIIAGPDSCSSNGHDYTS